MKIGMNSWIIQDGNYTDFKKGDVRDFALEFAPVDLHESTKQIKEYKILEESNYKINAKVIYLETETHPCTRVSGISKNRVETKGQYNETIIVLDLGDIMVFDESHQDRYEKDGFVEGIIWIGIDPFFYKEYHCERPSMPTLTYSWQIEKIEILTAPLIEATRIFHGKERKVRQRDETKIAYKEIERTDAWEDDEGHASYILTVTKGQ